MREGWVVWWWWWWWWWGWCVCGAGGGGGGSHYTCVCVYVCEKYFSRARRRIHGDVHEAYNHVSVCSDCKGIKHLIWDEHFLSLPQSLSLSLSLSLPSLSLSSSSLLMLDPFTTYTTALFFISGPSKHPHLCLSLSRLLARYPCVCVSPSLVSLSVTAPGNHNHKIIKMLFGCH